MERQPATWIARSPDATPVRRDDRAADSKPHPQTSRLAGHEVIEHALKFGFVQPDAAVAHANGDAARVDEACFDVNLPFTVAGGSDRIFRIDDQVQDDLPQLDWIAV